MTQTRPWSTWRYESMSLGFGLQWVMTFHDIWFPHKDGDQAESSFR